MQFASSIRCCSRSSQKQRLLMASIELVSFKSHSFLTMLSGWSQRAYLRRSVIGNWMQSPTENLNSAAGKFRLSLKMGQTRVLLGAAFGATLYRSLVPFCAIRCNMVRAYKPYIMSALWLPLRRHASPCKRVENGLKIRRGQPRGGSTAPPGTKIKANQMICKGQNLSAREVFHARFGWSRYFC